MKCGYAIKDITAPIGCCLSGYPQERITEGVADPIMVRAAAFQEDGLAVILYYDLVGIKQALAQSIRERVAANLGCEPKDIFVCCTHTHYAPNVSNQRLPISETYVQWLHEASTLVAQEAVADLTEAKVSYARSELPGISFTRRYRMKDGSCKTNPGRRNPNIAGPLTPADEVIQLLRITREGADEILLVNFQVHADVMRGLKMSADYPGVVCNTLELALPGTKCVYINGTAGDLNHIDVNCPEWDENGGLSHVQHMGRTIAGKILSMYTKARPVSCGKVRTIEQCVPVKVKRPTEEQIEAAKAYIRRYEAGEITDPAERTPTIVYEAYRTIDVTKVADFRDLFISGFSIGDICFAGFPGEAFCDVGRQIRETSPFAVQYLLGITNGYEGYFPTEDAYGVDGYERRTSPFQPGVAETLCAAGKDMVAELYKEY